MTTVNTPPKTVQSGFKKQFDALAEQAKAKKAPSSTSAQGASATTPAKQSENAKAADTVAEMNRDRFEPAGAAKGQTVQGALLAPSSPAGSGGTVQGLAGEQLRAALDAARLAGGAGAKNVKTPDVKPK